MNASSKSSILEWLYPSRCGLCGMFDDRPICSTCSAEFKPLTRTVAPMFGELDFRASLFVYETRAAQAVRRLKYSRVTSLAEPLSMQLREAYEELGLDACDAIVPVPVHWTRRCQRGFNQSDLLAQALPTAKVRPALLRRAKATAPQAALKGAARLKNLSGAFRASPEVAGMHVLLVDDVYTTGHTARECAAELKRMGATRVGVLTLTAEASSAPE